MKNVLVDIIEAYKKHPVEMSVGTIIACAAIVLAVKGVDRTPAAEVTYRNSNAELTVAEVSKTEAWKCKRATHRKLPGEAEVSSIFQAAHDDCLLRTALGIPEPTDQDRMLQALGMQRNPMPELVSPEDREQLKEGQAIFAKAKERKGTLATLLGWSYSS